MTHLHHDIVTVDCFLCFIHPPLHNIRTGFAQMLKKKINRSRTERYNTWASANPVTFWSSRCHISFTWLKIDSWLTADFSPRKAIIFFFFCRYISDLMNLDRQKETSFSKMNSWLDSLKSCGFCHKIWKNFYPFFIGL